MEILNRALVSLALIIPTILIVLKGETSLLLLMNIAVVLMMYEFYSLISKKIFRFSNILALFVGLLIPTLLYYKKSYKILVLVIVSTTFILIVERVLKGEVDSAITEISQTLFGVLYIPTLLSYLILIKNCSKGSLPLFNLPVDEGRVWILTTLAFAAISDTAGFLVGKFLGRRALAPTISPKKSIEGSIASIIATTCFSIFAQYTYLNLKITFIQALFLGIVGSTIAQLGDLGESLFKRDRGAKDSGFILLEHGGLLDRCDSLLFMAPFIYYFIKVIGRIK